MNTHNIDGHEPNAHQSHATSRANEAAYVVGYGRPPKATQFQPGLFVDLNGRPKGAPKCLERTRRRLHRIGLPDYRRRNFVPRIAALLVEAVRTSARGK